MIINAYFQWHKTNDELILFLKKIRDNKIPQINKNLF